MTGCFSAPQAAAVLLTFGNIIDEGELATLRELADASVTSVLEAHAAHAAHLAHLTGRTRRAFRSCGSRWAWLRSSPQPIAIIGTNIPTRRHRFFFSSVESAL